MGLSKEYFKHDDHGLSLISNEWLMNLYTWYLFRECAPVVRERWLFRHNCRKVKNPLRMMVGLMMGHLEKESYIVPYKQWFTRKQSLKCLWCDKKMPESIRFVARIYLSSL